MGDAGASEDYAEFAEVKGPVFHRHLEAALDIFRKEISANPGVFALAGHPSRDSMHILHFWDFQSLLNKALIAYENAKERQV